MAGITSTIPTGTTGQILQAVTDATPTFSTATYPATAGTSGNFLTSDGTNFVSTPIANLSYKSLPLTSLQIKALHATPIQFIPNQGSGKVIVIVNAWSKMTYGGNNAFVAGAGQTIQLTYGTAPIAFTALASNSMITQTSSNYLSPALTSITLNAIANLDNIAMNAYNPIATEITGNANNDNIITLSALYYVISI